VTILVSARVAIRWIPPRFLAVDFPSDRREIRLKIQIVPMNWTDANRSSERFDTTAILP
jgi:hypothetical protein